MKRLLTLFLFLTLFFRLNAQDFIWAKSMGGPSGDIGHALTIDIAGNIYATGTFSGTVDFDPGVGVHDLNTLFGNAIFFQKLNADGDFVWAKTIEDNEAVLPNSISLDNNGNIIIAGTFWGDTVDFDPGPGVYNIIAPQNNKSFLLKLDPSGNFLWARMIGGLYTVLGRNIEIDDSGNIYTTGSFWGTADFDPGVNTYNLTSFAGSEVFIQKLNSQGNFVWAGSFSGGSYMASSIALGLDNDIFLTMRYTDVVDVEPGPAVQNYTELDHDLLILKLDNSGNLSWLKSLKTQQSSVNIHELIRVGAAGSLYIMGQSNIEGDFNPGTGTDTLFEFEDKTYFLKLDAEGEFVWARQIIELQNGYFTLDNSDNIIVAGSFSGTVDFDPGNNVHQLVSEATDIYLMKMDSLGTLVSAEKFGNTQIDQAMSVTSDVLGNIYTIGSFSGTVDFATYSPVFNLTSNGDHDVFIQKLGATMGVAQPSLPSAAFTIYPNPTNKTVNISSLETIDKITVTDAVGRKVYESSPNNRVARIDLDTAGIYFITISSKGNKTTQKLVVNH